MNCDKCGCVIKLADAVVDRYEHGQHVATWCLPCYNKTKEFHRATDYKSYDNYRTPKEQRIAPRGAKVAIAHTLMVMQPAVFNQREK